MNRAPTDTRNYCSVAWFLLGRADYRRTKPVLDDSDQKKEALERAANRKDRGNGPASPEFGRGV